MNRVREPAANLMHVSMCDVVYRLPALVGDRYTHGTEAEQGGRYHVCPHIQIKVEVRVRRPRGQAAVGSGDEIDY